MTGILTHMRMIIFHGVKSRRSKVEGMKRTWFFLASCNLETWKPGNLETWQRITHNPQLATQF